MMQTLKNSLWYLKKKSNKDLGKGAVGILTTTDLWLLLYVHKSAIGVFFRFYFF